MSAGIEKLCCPHCRKRVVGYVIDSRTVDGGNGVRRRRKCEKCNQRWTTYEFTKQMFNEHPAVNEVLKDAQDFLMMAVRKIEVAIAQPKVEP